MKKATEVAKSLFRDKCPHTGNKFSQGNCFDCLSSAIRAQVKEALEEAEKQIVNLKDNAASSVRMLGLGYPSACVHAIQAIQKLKEEVQ